MAEEDVKPNTDSTTGGGANTAGLNEDMLANARMEIERILAGANPSAADFETIKSILAANPGVESKVNIPPSANIPEELRQALTPAKTSDDAPDQQPQRMQAAEEAKPIDSPQADLSEQKEAAVALVRERAIELGATPQVANMIADRAAYDMGQSRDAASYAVNNTDDTLRTTLKEITPDLEGREKLNAVKVLTQLEMNGIPIVADAKNYTSGLFPSEAGAPAQNTATAPAIDNGLAI